MADTKYPDWKAAINRGLEREREEQDRKQRVLEKEVKAALTWIEDVFLRMIENAVAGGRRSILLDDIFWDAYRTMFTRSSFVEALKRIGMSVVEEPTHDPLRPDYKVLLELETSKND